MSILYSNEEVFFSTLLGPPYVQILAPPLIAVERGVVGVSEQLGGAGV